MHLKNGILEEQYWLIFVFFVRFISMLVNKLKRRLIPSSENVVTFLTICLNELKNERGE